MRFRKTADNLWLGYLLQRYTTLLLGVAMKYLKDKALAEDAVQQVFFKSLTHLPKENIQNFKGWLYVLTRNHCLQLLRDKAYHLPEESLKNLPGIETDTENILWKEHTLEHMETAMQELPPEQRKCIDDFYLKKMNYSQISERTGYTFMQVKSYIQNGKRNLKAILLKKQSGAK